MDLLAQHEAFLRAIFDAPDDDTPRLVYADFLEENGDEDRAAYIRYECEAARCDQPRCDQLDAARLRLIAKHATVDNDPWPWDDDRTVRGFPEPPSPARLGTERLADPRQLREDVVKWSPEVFGATAMKLVPPPALTADQVETLFALPFVQRVTEWDFSGRVEEAASEPDEVAEATYALIDMTQQTVITTFGVEVLARQRAARRVTALDLRNNNLDNDAARAIVRSPYLGNLKRLRLLEGNRLRGRVWQLVIERFGEDVVG